MFEGWTLDHTVNIEGHAKALAALGAATAYVIDLTQRRRQRRRENLYGARGRLILEVVQLHYEAGVDEKEIVRVLTAADEDAEALRKQYGVHRHDAGSEFARDLERHLIELVFDRLIEIDQPNHYRFYGSDRWTQERRREEERASSAYEMREQRDRELLRRKDELREALRDGLSADTWEALKNGKGSAWKIGGLLENLLILNEPLTPEDLRNLIESWPPESRHEIVEAVTRFVSKA